MHSPKTFLLKEAFILIFILFSLVKVGAQCNPPDQLPTGECETAPLTCLNDACYETQSNFGGPPYNQFCGPNTVIHNPQFFQFIATSTMVEIHIHVDDCDNGSGLQSAIIDGCPWDIGDVLVCDPNENIGGTMILIYDGLEIDSTYYLMIDGSSGAICQYTIEYVDGVYTPDITEELDPSMSGADPGIVCQGFDDFLMVTGPEIGFAHGYYWVLGWSGDTVTSTLPELTMDIPNNAPPGVWEICVWAFSGCDTTDNEVCFEVEIVEVDDEYKDPEIFCPEEFPFVWQGVPIAGPGEYKQSFDNDFGCPYDSIWQVEAYPDIEVGELDVLFCQNDDFDPYQYEGELYDQSGNYDLFYPGLGQNGCDSTAELNLTLAGIDAFIELTCDNGEFELMVLIQELVPTNADVSFQWYESGIAIDEINPLLVLDGGNYEVEITIETNAGSCVYTLPIFSFDAESLRPDPPVLGHGDTSVCAQEGVVFEVIVDPFEDPYEYVWSATPASIEVDQDGSSVATFDFSFTQGGEVCVYAINECGDGLPTCFNVDIHPTPVVSFSYETDVCADSFTVITFTGSAGPNAIPVWDFDSPSSVVGSGFGPYTVSWSLPGDKVINLLVIEPGCDSVPIYEIITVSNFFPPTINCSSTINSVSFEWNDVVGAGGYTVSINGGTPFSVPTSDYDTTGLPPGTVINMTLTVISSGACDDIVMMTSCTAENCPPPVIILSGQDSFCLNAPNPVILNAVVDGNPGSGIWSGNGITDPIAGEFSPGVAGSGQHQLTYTVDVNGCPFSSPFLVIVFDSMTADFVVDPLICITDVANVTYTGNVSGGSPLFDWDFGTATVVSGSGSGPYQLRYASAGNKTIRLQISENGCSTDIVTNNLTVAPVLNAPVVNCSPMTTSVEFTWIEDPMLNYTVNTITGQTGTQAGSSIEFLGLLSGDVVQIEITTTGSGPCPAIVDTFECIAQDCPMPSITVTPVPDICLYPGTSPVTLQVDVQNGNGVGDWSGPGITNTVTGIFDPVLAGAGTHPIVYHYVDANCHFNESITINVDDVPVAFISNTSLVLTCASANMLTLDGSGSSGTGITYLWSTNDGVFGTNVTLDQVDVLAPGTYQLLVTSNNCVDSMSVVVTQDANTPIPCAGEDKVLTCDSISFVLGCASSGAANLVYSWTTLGGNIVGPVDGLQITIDEPGEYTIVVRDTINGCQSTDRAIVTIDTSLAGLTLVPGDTIDCNTPLSEVDATVVGGNESDYIFTWTTTDGEIVGSTNVPDIDVSQGGNYTVKIENKNNGCQKSASASVPESDEIIDDVDVSVMNIRCFGEDNGALVINNVIGGIPDYTYQWSVTPQNVTSLSSLAPGSYNLTVTDANGCSFTTTFTLTEPLQLTLDLGPNQTVAVDDSVTIDISTNASLSPTPDIQWSGYAGLDCPGCLSLEFIATSSATFTALLTDTAGCIVSDSMRLTVIVPKIIYIPTVFSPNDDDTNDYFTISGRRNLEKIEYLRIYDRWGNQVFEKVNLEPNVQEEGWDGTFNGDPLSPGVYVYVAKLMYEDISETVTGSITLIR